jgi:hypothetical protein
VKKRAIPLVLVILIAVVTIAALAYPQGDSAAEAQPGRPSQSDPAPPVQLGAPVAEIATKLSAFGRARMSRDASPRDGRHFGTASGVDYDSSRLVFSDSGRAVYAAPSRDRGTVCFLLTEDRPDAVWGLRFCGAAATLRQAPLVWNSNVVLTEAGRVVLIWGIVSPLIRSVAAELRGGGRLTAAPNGDGIFVIDASGSGTPTDLIASDSRGVAVERARLPRVPVP